jgi:cation transport regulator ChaB
MSVPYPSIASLPKDIREILPRLAQELFRNAFNATAEKSTEERALSRAWATVKTKFKKEGAKWIAKDSASSDNVFAFDEMIVLDAGAAIRKTSDGYLVCNPRIARIGVQDYAGWEVGRPDMERVRVYRPEEEVFHVDAIASLAFKPVTLEHPKEYVGADNWRKLAVGHLSGDVLRDGDFVRMPLIVMDAEAVAEVEDGKEQLSLGYSAMLEWGDGISPQGEAYNATQHDIRANHVAITQIARGGPKLRMGDNRKVKPKERPMPRSFVIDGITVEMEERDQQVVERAMAKLESDLGAAQQELNLLRASSATELATAKTETANATTAAQTKDAEIATLKQQLVDAKLTPQALDKLVHDRVQTAQKAKAILGDALVIDGKTDIDIKRQVVLAKLGDQAKDWNDDMVTASFNTLTAVAAAPNTNDSMRLGDVLLLNNNGNTDPRNKAYAEYDEALSNRWKTAGMRSQ